jgi:hypothetical protein
VYDLLESESVSEKWKESILKHQEERKKTLAQTMKNTW